jgi:Zn-dependent protease with chaperone function
VGRRGGFAFLDWLAPRLYLFPQLFVMVVGGALLGVATGSYAGLVLLLALIVLLLPFAMRFLFPAHVMVGPLADRLDLLARRSGVRLRGMLVWETRTRRVATACVTGFFAWNRYVYFTDGLLDALEADEVEAVFAHEVSHVRCRHLPLLLALAVGGVAFSFGGTYVLLDTVSAAWREVVVLLCVALFLLLPFARISRILELEADFTALQLGANPVSLTRALQKLRILGGKPQKRHGWRHFSIPYRVRAIENWVSSAAFRRRFHRLRRAAVAATVAILLGGGLCFFFSGAHKEAATGMEHGARAASPSRGRIVSGP